MLRLVLVLALGVIGVWAQEHAAEEHKSGAVQEVSIWWKWANFAICAPMFDVEKRYAGLLAMMLK